MSARLAHGLGAARRPGPPAGTSAERNRVHWKPKRSEDGWVLGPVVGEVAGEVPPFAAEVVVGAVVPREHQVRHLHRPGVALGVAAQHGLQIQVQGAAAPAPLPSEHDDQHQRQQPQQEQRQDLCVLGDGTGGWPRHHSVRNAAATPVRPRRQAGHAPAKQRGAHGQEQGFEDHHRRQ